MAKLFHLTPPSASTFAPQVDFMTLVLFIISMIFACGIAITILFYVVRYHYRSDADRTNPSTYNIPLELAWTGLPILLGIGLFIWGSKLFVDSRRPPANALPIYVVGKQWMWKIQHPEGQREIDELHIPMGRPVKLLLISQDVVHDFYIPAFRVKQDVLPGRYTLEWFEATRPGTYHFFCAQYCGSQHSAMIGRVVVMTPRDYARWLAASPDGSMAAQGEQLFHQYGCISCHRTDSGRRGPQLDGLYESVVRLKDGVTTVADEVYLRRSILDPAAQIVEGFEPIMPTFQGQINEEEVLRLIAYIKSLGVPHHGS